MVTLKFYSSVRLDIRRVATLKERENSIGIRCKVKVVKNKLAAPFRTAEFDLMYDGTGISREGDVLDVGVDLEIIEKTGTWFSYENERLGQGRENAKHFLRDNTDIYDRISHQVREKLGISLKTK